MYISISLYIYIYISLPKWMGVCPISPCLRLLQDSSVSRWIPSDHDHFLHCSCTNCTVVLWLQSGTWAGQFGCPIFFCVIIFCFLSWCHFPCVFKSLELEPVILHWIYMYLLCLAMFAFLPFCMVFVTFCTSTSHLHAIVFDTCWYLKHSCGSFEGSLAFHSGFL